ncbi:MFS transporter [Pseudomonas sp. NPDC090233]|uniref:MFS transporter n=1 Tax=Pseudomonas sp. NPDC090233 TaxID=3364479 RepID=UPI00383A699B
MNSPTTDAARQGTAITDEQPHWSGVFAMTLCVFALIASEFMPVSLLSPIANDLGISEGLAGYGIAISGAFAVLTSLSISRVAGAMNRKTLLLLMTALMCVSGLVVGLASNYFIYMVGRAFIGVVIGGFWSMSAAVAIRLVPTVSVPKALAIFNGGNALATVVAAPLGSYLGGVIGWRGAFLCLVPIGLVALAWQWISLPSMHAQKREAGSSSVFKLLGNPLVALGMLAVGLFFMGQFELFTYIRPFLETVTQVDVPTLSTMLLALGIAGFLGTLFIGSFLKKGLYPTLIIIPLLMAALGIALVIFGGSVAVVFVLLSLWGLVATAAPVGWWSWLALSVPEDAEAGGGLMVAVIQLSIALGSTLGGVLFDSQGYQATFVAAAALLVASAGVSLLTARTKQAVMT